MGWSIRFTPDEATYAMGKILTTFDLLVFCCCLFSACCSAHYILHFFIDKLSQAFSDTEILKLSRSNLDKQEKTLYINYRGFFAG